MTPPFTKVLVANRGEIAVRVIRACRELGVATVAVHSDADAGALHVRLADEAIPLGGATAAESYLNIPAVLAALRDSEAEAVHPGYGFHAEGADFARAVTGAGAVFIGPSADAIATMGDKLSARQAAARAGVAGVPGTDRDLSCAAEVIDFGQTHGWPVAIKAAFGGGGRGIRVVRGAAEAEAALHSARHEAMAGFGRAECYVEKYLDRPRHIEMQIIADTHGTCVWLGERDCSVQRRHQKILEEAPAPDFPDRVRQAMGAAAVRIAQECSYVNAGTVEFLYAEGEFWFLEMNTRLQVEHPVTEWITGIDLVAEQLRVAAGEPLSFGQDDIDRRGHALEFRLNAEDPSAGAFLPAPGPLTVLSPPQGLGVRWDGGYEAGDEVSPYYDNLIGKLVIWARDRSTAIARSRRALAEFRVEGTATTIGAQQAILDHPDFLAGRHYTRWAETELDLSGLAVAPAPATQRGQSTGASGAHGAADRTAPRSQEVRVGQRWYAVPRFDHQTRDGAPAVSSGPARGGTRSGTDGRQRVGSGAITAQMPATVVKVLVEVGDTVAATEPVCVLEAMKMELTLTADQAGVVRTVSVSPGQSVRPGEVLVVVEEEAGTA